MSKYRQQLEDYLGELEIKADVVFDVGGAQNPVHNRLKSIDTKDYGVLDLPLYDLEDPDLFSTEMVPPTVPFVRAFNKADVVFCLEVFEYLIDPFTAMHNLAAFLKPGGTAYVSFPLVYPTHNEIDKDSLRYTEAGIRRLMIHAGLSPYLWYYRRDESGALEAFYEQDGMRAAKGYDHSIYGFIVTAHK